MLYCIALHCAVSSKVFFCLSFPFSNRERQRIQTYKTVDHLDTLIADLQVLVRVLQASYPVDKLVMIIRTVVFSVTIVENVISRPEGTAPEKKRTQ